MSERHQDYTHKTDEGLLELTEVGENALRPWVTNIDGNVYAFTSEADTQTVSAGMARLSRNSNGLREIIASEFIGSDTKDTELLGRVVSQFGDDSVMQLYPMQVVFEGISNIATKEIEWGRLAAYLEQSTRYLRFDKKDANGHYAFYTPEEFDPDTFDLYEQSQTNIFDIYSDLYTKLKQHIMDTSSTPESERDAAWSNACHAQACDGVRALLPASTKATVGFTGSSQAVQNTIFHLMSHELQEMNTLGTKTLAASRQVAPVFFERTDNPTRGGLIINHQEKTRINTKELTRRILAGSEPEIGHDGLSVNLISVDGTEDELVTKILVDSSNYSHDYISGVVENLTDEDKALVISTYVGERYNRRAKPGRAFELLHYYLEIQCDYGAFRDIQRHRLVDGFEWQSLQTKLGHVTPPAIVEAGLEAEYEKAFDISTNLYMELQARGYTDQAQYATLFGHIMRFSMKVNARSLVHTAELRTTPQGHPAYRKVYQEIHRLVSEVHPHVAEAMVFVSQAEDEELARLGAERYNQQKAEANTKA